jgi:acetyltransferase-like isoleucine patch superfamily enzyme
MASVFVVQTLLLALAAAPAITLWLQMNVEIRNEWLRVAALAAAVVPSYLLFAFLLAVFSGVTTGLLGWRTPANAALRIADLEWPLLAWVRYLVITHVVRVLVGSLFRASPLWTLYLRLNGARLGRGVFINSLFVNDHNLLDFGDRVVIGGDAHISGHTVEGGFLKTAHVRLGPDVTIGIGAVIGIGVEAGPGCQVGALSLAPKHAKLEAGGVYAGIPVRRIDDAGGEAHRV